MLARTLPAGTMRLDRHPDFVAYLRSLPRTEVGLHGLHHIHRGVRIPIEFQGRSRAECAAMLRRGLDIFEAAGLPRPRGMSPPGWDIDDELAIAMVAVNLEYVASARAPHHARRVRRHDRHVGPQGGPAAPPHASVRGRFVHVPSNFSATNPLERAEELVEAGGLLSIKAHIVKYAFGHVMLDGIDALYRNYLHLLLCELEDRYGDRLWFATMAELAERAATVQVPLRTPLGSR